MHLHSGESNSHAALVSSRESSGFFYDEVLALLGFPTVVSLFIFLPGHLDHHDGAVGAHAGVKSEWELAVVLVEDGAHGSVPARYRGGQEELVWLDRLDVGQLWR